MNSLSSFDNRKHKLVLGQDELRCVVVRYDKRYGASFIEKVEQCTHVAYNIMTHYKFIKMASSIDVDVRWIDVNDACLGMYRGR